MSDAKPGFKGLRLYNTLTRAKQDFVPIDPANVRMYVCGPTVYDFAHIGNARPAIVFDVLYRLLRHLYGADRVTYVRNITDVDDKINARALRDFGPEIEAGRMSLNDAIARVTEKTADQYHSDVSALGCLPPTHEPRATEHIEGMIVMIGTLIERGHAYEAAGEVLFDVASMPAYGGLSKRNLDEQIAGARVAVDSHKKNPGDFVLWKQSSAEEPGWGSPWGRGRPGWHIECSVMSEHHLGKVFDIHGGGLDLIFPHHENEIAQSCCAHGTDKMANYWLHNGFVQVEGRKMSKSEGNFVTIHDLLHTDTFGGRKWPGEVLRLAMLMTHYREPIDFSVKRLEEANANLTNWLRQIDEHVLSRNSPTAYSAILDAAQNNDQNDNLAISVEVLSDDLAMPNVIAQLHGMSTDISLGVRSPRSLAWDMMGILGFLGIIDAEVLRRQKVEPEGLSQRIAERLAIQDAADAAKAAGDKDLMKQKFAEADRIRADLAAEGILLKDGKDPQTGQRVTTWEVKR
ncbi:cysteine--tRNA ligase [Polymorphum gilvum]|uniref:Cysteine--tRNA ligase n=1 Tax=Polymorphum gilvum (strain LMG 25793 / CGMCC 1.9160 / SL003B-26A1) TaxID=991905 RepID=F2J5A3_POLGS|nr:cysteine--tRNA ligase [Polymorphum gilvum]ADZ71162.1 Cysteine tRNA synthetase (Cysteine--tRNA ligase) [Polymorphum gilvum SL003B-26A1]